MDVRMPRRDGITTTRLLKANPSTQHIPILFLAAAATLEDRLEGLRSGAVDYILKPFEAEEVVEKVRIHLSLKQRLLTTLVTSAVAHTRLQTRGSRAGRKNDSAALLQRPAAPIIQHRMA